MAHERKAFAATAGFDIEACLDSIGIEIEALRHVLDAPDTHWSWVYGFNVLAHAFEHLRRSPATNEAGLRQVWWPPGEEGAE